MLQGKPLVVQSTDSSASESKLYVLVETDQMDKNTQGTPLLVHRRVNIGFTGVIAVVLE